MECTREAPRGAHRRWGGGVGGAGSSGEQGEQPPWTEVTQACPAALAVSGPLCGRGIPKVLKDLLGRNSGIFSHGCSSPPGLRGLVARLTFESNTCDLFL